MSQIRALAACGAAFALTAFCACAKNGDEPFARLPDARIFDASPIMPDVNPFLPDAGVDGGDGGSGDASLDARPDATTAHDASIADAAGFFEIPDAVVLPDAPRVGDAAGI